MGDYSVYLINLYMNFQSQSKTDSVKGFHHNSKMVAVCYYRISRQRPFSWDSWPPGWRRSICRLWARNAARSKCRPAFPAFSQVFQSFSAFSQRLHNNRAAKSRKSRLEEKHGSLVKDFQTTFHSNTNSNLIYTENHWDGR